MRFRTFCKELKKKTGNYDVTRFFVCGNNIFILSVLLHELLYVVFESLG